MAEARHKPDDDSRIADEAAAWVLRSDRGLTASEQDDYSEWLAADPRHRNALSRQRACWQRLDRLAEWRPAHSAQPNPDLLSPPLGVRLRRYAPAIGALAAAVIVLVAWLVWRPSGESPGTAAFAERATPTARMKPILPAKGERRLEDGSVIQLNEDAAVSIRYTPAERRVILERGEARFAVMKDPSRPFVVCAAGIDVCAVGTAFSVRVDPSSVEVLVTHGRVELEPALAPASGSAHPAPAGPRPPPVPLEARQRAIVPLTAGPVTPQIATLTTGEITRVLAWQHRFLDFTAVPLRDVIQEFNRRNVVQLVVDPELAAVRVSAAIRSDNVEGLVRLLEAGFGARTERPSDSEIRLYHGE